MDKELSPEDGLAVLRAQMDQAAALQPEIARMAKNWYDAFTARGFTPAQAVYLTAAQLFQDPGRPA